MKILILAQSRSGSTSLFRAIRRALKIPTLKEPFCPAKRKTELALNKDLDTIIQYPDLLVKIIDNHFYRCSRLSHYQNLTQYFDRVIGLTREDDEANAKSYLIAAITRNWFDYTKRPGVEESILEDNFDLYKQCLANSKRRREEILSFDIYQATYEGLYIRRDQITNLVEYLGFPIIIS